MLEQLRPRLTYANVMATIAMFIALGGGAYALAIPRNSVGAKQIKTNAIRAPEIKASAVRSSEVKDASLLATDFERGQLSPGPAGPPGKDGVNGAANVTYRSARTAPLAQGEFGRITAGCQPGERLIGGGAGFPLAPALGGNYEEFSRLAASGPGILTNANFHLARAIADGEAPNVWFAGGEQMESSSRSLVVYAVCAAP